MEMGETRTREMGKQQGISTPYPKVGWEEERDLNIMQRILQEVDVEVEGSSAGRHLSLTQKNGLLVSVSLHDSPPNGYRRNRG